ncbi:endosome-associated-trafficking regulator 1 [Antrostomus carolinensis]|nr:endosome-associated-trafficking regulator 1 [Antrostomus carolinensis]
MERVGPESQVLEDDDANDANNDEFSCPCHSTCPPPQSKGCDSVGDSQVEDLGEAISFSLNPRHSYVMKEEGVKTGIHANKLAKHALEIEKEDQEFQEPFYKDMEMPGSLSEDEDYSWTSRLPVHQRSHVLQTARMPLYGSYDSFQCSTGKHLGMDDLAPRAHASDPYLGYSECTREGEPHMQQEQAIGDREFPCLQLTCDVLKEENATLKMVVRSLKSSLEIQVQRVQSLERQLKASLEKEERETQEQQSFLQQTEWSLQLMTQRALEAESNVEKLKLAIFILQEELESSQVENENLRAGQTTDLGAVKQNIDFALQNLHQIITGANWSIKQLTSGAESLRFVADVLKSTGKISEVEAEEEL